MRRGRRRARGERRRRIDELDLNQLGPVENAGRRVWGMGGNSAESKQEEKEKGVREMQQCSRLGQYDHPTFSALLS